MISRFSNAVAFVLLSLPLMASEARPADCVPALDDLYYPPAVVQARIQGFVSTTFRLGADGRATDVASKGHPFLAWAVEETLQSAPPVPECAGQVITVGVRFVLDDLRVETPEVRKLSSMQYEVLTPSPTVDVSNLDPAWVFTRRGRFLHHLKAWLSRLK
jgi:hypothetical protein